MLRYLIITSIVLFALSAKGQVTLYSADFEPPFVDWLIAGDLTPNEWRKSSCPGNGPSDPAGINSFYISEGGVGPGCGIGNQDQYSYTNSPSGIKQTVGYTTIVGNCASDLQVTFDYRIDGVLTQDYAELVYSIDGGASWIPVGSSLTMSTAWTSTTISLPPSLNFSTFLLGVRFTYDNAVINGFPIAIDNFVVTGTDTVNPSITCPISITQPVNASCIAIADDYITGMVLLSDNCTDSVNILVTQTPSEFSVIPVSPGNSLTVTLTAKDEAGNTAQCTFTLNIIDTIKPNVICPVPSLRYLNTSCETAIPDFTSTLSWTDNCTSSAALMTFTQVPVGGTLTSTNQTITLTAVDQAGNSQSCSFIQTVIDTIRPQLFCLPNQTINMNASCFAALPDYIPLTFNNENCFFVTDVVYTQSPIATTTINGVTTITITGTDESGNIGTCAFTVTPIDVTNPSITCPSNSTISTNVGCTYVLPNVSSLAVVSDNCTSLAALTFSQSPSIGTALPFGSNMISITVNDLVGNTATCNYQLTVADQIIPTVVCPLAQSVNVDVNCSGTIADYTSLVVASDNCSSLAQLSITQSPISGSTINGNTQITMTITDALSNVATCTFFAVVIDNIDPVITCPSTANIVINSSCQYNIPDLSSSIAGSDNCSSLANMVITQNPLAGTLSIGLTAVLITLTDQNGNSSTCITMMTPIDIEVPVITCPTPTPINNGVNCDFTLTNFASTALVLDNCPGYSITQNPAPGSIIQAGTQLIQLEVMDAGGNLAQCSFNLTVIESVAPTITCPSNISTCNPLVNYLDPTFNDNCFAFLTQTDVTGLSSGDIFPIGITTLSYTVEDSSSNMLTCFFQVEVLSFPSIASIAIDTISLCDITSSVIEALPATSGTGEWTLLSGGGNFNNQFANLTGVNNLDYGTNVFVWTISTADCGSTSDTITIIVSQTPLAASTLDTVYACNSLTFDLSANVPLYGVGTWSTNLGATINDINLATSSVSNLAPGWNQFIWLITSGSCPSTSDTLQLYSSSIASINEQDTAICLENLVFELNATIPAVDQTATWVFISGSGDISDFNSPSPTVENFGLGSNTLIYNLEHDLCPTTTDTITIVTSLCEDFNPIFPTVITPNLDGKNDLFVINYLEKVYPNCYVVIFNRYGSIVFESTGYEDPWNGTFKGEELPMGTYFYKIELNDDESTVFNGPISIIH